MTNAAAGQGRILERVQMPKTPYISPDATGSVMGINKGRLADIAGLHRNTFRNPKSVGVQNGLREIIRIVTIAESLCGDTDKALFWFNNEQLALLRFGDRRFGRVGEIECGIANRIEPAPGYGSAFA